mmetsp:Transcript_27987/g.43061  ORF Transcript_27987/g.43061 Transcript_27987/m.43061 type:complete len:124 (-) Transcript_27987:1030-1401(-)
MSYSELKREKLVKNRDDLVKVNLLSWSKNDMQKAGTIVESLKQKIPENLTLGSIVRICLPRITKRYCVLRSPHVNKDSREHINSYQYKRTYYIFHRSNYLDLLKELSDLRFPPNVNCKIILEA